jgi:hypothetical protein
MCRPGYKDDTTSFARLHIGLARSGETFTARAFAQPFTIRARWPWFLGTRYPAVPLNRNIEVAAYIHPTDMRAIPLWNASKNEIKDQQTNHNGTAQRR